MTGRVRSDEQGVVTVLFALLLGLIMMFGSIVISVGSWYTHARQLQTKADAAALAGGAVWSWPCAPDVDLRIRDTARLFFGAHTGADGSTPASTYNRQVGGVGSDQLYVTLNQGDWWDDSFPGPDFTQPAGSVCEAGVVDVKATENDSPLLWGWLPFLPDIKRKARVEIEQADGLMRMLPIAVRVPKPVASAAVFFNEATGDILSVRYFEEDEGIAGLPAGLNGYSTRLSGDPPLISLAGSTGVAIALSFRPACGTPDTVPPCLDIGGYSTVNALCNQGASIKIVQCYHGSGDWPSRNVTTGLHFLRGYPTGSVGNRPPQLRGASLESSACESNGYFNSMFVGGCAARLTVNVDLGSVVENVGGGGGGDDDDDGKGKGKGGGGGGCVTGSGNKQTRVACNIEVRYALVNSDGDWFCDNYGTQCELHPADGLATGSNVTYRTTGAPDAPHVPLTAMAGAHAIAIQIRVRGSSVSPNPGGCGVSQNFNENCRWFHTGAGIFGTSVPPAANAIFAAPVQRAFMGDLDKSGPVKWLRVGKDENCDRTPEDTTPAAATHPTAAQACFFVDMGLKGGKAQDQDEPPFSFAEGSGPSQMGFLDCDPTVPHGQALMLSVVNGCKPLYSPNEFDTDPLCPDQSQFFTLPKPAPFDDWEPIDCVKTRPTGGGNQLIEGLNERIFHAASNPQCPPDAPGYVEGRNYWHRLNNGYTAVNFAWDSDTPAVEGDDLGNRLKADDPRLVSLFFTPYNTFSSSGQEVFPVVQLGYFYITGYGRLNGHGGFQGGGPDDPCTGGNNGDLYDGSGNEPPPDLNQTAGNSSGAVIWGHFIKYLPQGSLTSGGNGKPCDVDGLEPCVAILVE